MAIQLARGLVDEAAAIDATASRRDRRQRARLRTLVLHPGAAAFTVQLTDEIPRIPSQQHAARRFASLVRDADLSMFSTVDRTLLAVGARIAPHAPRLVMPMVVRRLQAESAGVILSADDPAFAEHIARRRRQGVRCNVNVLGEAILGDDEATRRLELVLARLRRADVDYVSVKISSICAGISTLAFDETVTRVAERLRTLYGAAAAFDPPKFVNLDMEEYRDLDLTVAGFRLVLDEPAFERLDAGIVLQAYLPDARRVARELTEWTLERHARAGGRIKVRIVKGANLAMETVEAELNGWQLAPFDAKAAVDANFKAILDVLTEPAFDQAIRVGVASHNLFDVAWALVLRDEMAAAGRPSRIEIEMLEGMAASQSEAVLAAAGELLLYAPVVTRRDFPAAIAYLVRRLDENTSPENFLSHLFDLADDPQLFDEEAARFGDAVRSRWTVGAERRRTQQRGIQHEPVRLEAPFVNAADTDWTHPANRQWIAEHLAVDDPIIATNPDITVATIEACVATARAAQSEWTALGVRGRAEIVHAVGDVFEEHRGRVLAVMVAEAGKTVAEGDPEVSEAIDFARYYGYQALRLAQVEGATGAPRGTVVVTPPWNFPFAIPAGGVLAALAAGNTVILKPAPQTVRTAALIAELCWDAGVPRDVLQFVPAPDGDVGRRLITHPDVAAVILTGAYATAAMFHSWRPELRLHAETSGKNAITITAAADVDRAVADLVRSAFGHAGQKCSAASLAIVEAPLYDDPSFLERIRDAAATLRVGPSSDLVTDLAPLVDRPSEALERALTRLEPGERWLLEPACRSDDRRLWSPGIRIGMQPGSWFARTECFGPVLGIIRADDLRHAIRIQNSTEFGLTAGLHSLDPNEIEHWLEAVEAGNLYVNRGVTGAIVQRQPFGGWKRSVVGPTAKAGGPNYVATLVDWRDDTEQSIDHVAARFERWVREVAHTEHDPTGLAAERNVFRYRPLRGGVAVRCAARLPARDRSLVDLAARATGCRVVISDAANESDTAFAARLGSLHIDRLRLLDVRDDVQDDARNDANHGAADPDSTVRRAAHVLGVAVDDAPPVGAPEIELPRWLHEQSVTTTIHRHGRLPSPPAGA